MGEPILLITRPRAAAERFLAGCREAHDRPLDGLVAPIMEIAPLPAAIAWDAFDALVLTSSHALCDRDPPAGMRAWCVGDGTAEAARAKGLHATSAAGDAGALVDALRRGDPGRCLHLRGRHGADIAARLRAHGIAAEERIVYDQVARPLSKAALAALAGDRRVVLPLFSPRSARLLAERIGTPGAPLHPVAISPAAAASWPFRPPPDIAGHPDGAGMVRAVLHALR